MHLVALKRITPGELGTIGEGKGPVYITNWKGAGPYPEMERGKSMRRNHPKLSHPTHPPTHSPIRAVESTQKTGVGIRNSPKFCLACALCTNAPSQPQTAMTQVWNTGSCRRIESCEVTSSNSSLTLDVKIHGNESQVVPSHKCLLMNR